MASTKASQSSPSGLLESIRSRATFAKLILEGYEQDGRRSSDNLQNAIDIYEGLLRELPETSAERPQYLSMLSYAQVSKYLTSMNRHDIDNAVRYGRLAKQEAKAAGLRERDVNSYCEILNNAGVALSYRSTATADTDKTCSKADMAESIDCAREMKTCVPRDNKHYQAAVFNLASRLGRHYAKHGATEDYIEATTILHELQATSGPFKDLATVQFVNLVVGKAQRTNTLEDLSNALRAAVDSIDLLPPNNESKPALLNQLSHLYVTRFEKAGDISDIKSALHYSNRLLDLVPISHAIRTRYLSSHFQLLHKLAKASESPEVAEEAVLEGLRRIGEVDGRRKVLGDTGAGFSEWLDCNKRYGDILGCKYLLSRDLADLERAMAHIKLICEEHNNRVDKSGTSPKVDTSLVYDLLTSLRKIRSAPAGNIKDVAVRKLYDSIASACESKTFWDAQLKFEKGFVTLQRVRAEAVQAQESITDEEASRRVADHLQRITERDKRTAQPRRSDDYTTVLGLRQLAIDPTNKRVVVDMRNIMSSILGYDVTKPMTAAELKANHLRTERESVEKARSKGEYPNPSLCHMCRVVKPLQPANTQNGNGGRGYEWNKQIYLPFGNWNQLSLRRSCVFCQLILDLIVSDRGRRGSYGGSQSLHPRLASIDREIQGVSLGVAKLSDGEEVLVVEYGMRVVGQLRIISPQNYLKTVRQGWLADSGQLRIGPFLNDDESVQMANIPLLKEWLAECDQNHGLTCTPSFATMVRYIQAVPLIFIDVIENRLVENTTEIKYFALSYAWGTVTMEHTFLKNYQSRCQPGGLPHELPNTIADAIDFVKSIGERYIWIDSLCIVQDDPQRKARDISNMDAVYSKAFATIVALGEDADSGLPGVGTRRRQPQRIQTLLVDRGSTKLDSNPDGKIEKDNIYLAATPRALDLALSDSPWDTRGWTFQERILSRRCIYFSAQYVYFACGRHDAILSECGVNSPMNSIHFTEKFDYLQQPIKIHKDDTLLDLQRDIRHLGPNARRTKCFATYAQLVSRYTLRNLTQDSDIIDAFLGTFSVLNQFFQSDILCGLPASVFDRALLWTPAARNSRRGHDQAQSLVNAVVQGRPMHNQLLPTNRGTVLAVYGPSETQVFDDKLDRRFPSWSWVGWKGPVEYRLFLDALPDEPPPMPLIRDVWINHNGTALKKVVIEAQTESGVLSEEDDDFKPIDNPTIPNLLQFVAPCVPLPCFTISTQYEYMSRKDHVHAAGQQAVRHILDAQGKRCGLWWEQAGYVYVGRGVSSLAESKMMFVGISRHEDTYQPRPGPMRAEGQIRLFDTDVYPATGKESGLVNLLVVDKDMGHEYAERVTVARIHIKAWNEANPESKIVRLC